MPKEWRQLGKAGQKIEVKIDKYARNWSKMELKLLEIPIKVDKIRESPGEDWETWEVAKVRKSRKSEKKSQKWEKFMVEYESSGKDDKVKIFKWDKLERSKLEWNLPSKMVKRNELYGKWSAI